MVNTKTIPSLPPDIYHYHYLHLYIFILIVYLFICLVIHDTVQTFPDNCHRISTTEAEWISSPPLLPEQPQPLTFIPPLFGPDPTELIIAEPEA